MKKDQVIILEKRGTVLIKGEEASDFLQNIITNDIKKVSYKNSIFSALLKSTLINLLASVLFFENLSVDPQYSNFTLLFSRVIIGNFFVGKAL